MKVLVTGVSGQLGYDVIKVLENKNIECLGVSSNDFDITNYDDVERFIKEYSPTDVVHCAAYTAVDKAEDEAELCEKVNSVGTSNIAKVCKDINSRMVYISTDYVFTGEGNIEYEINDITKPIGVYGDTKLKGELAVISTLDNYFIIRISWVFGKNGNNFIKTMLRLGKERNELNVVSDQIGSPTYTADLAVLIYDMLNTQKYGIYHATNEGYCSWAEFAEEIFKQANLSVKVNYISSNEYPAKAKRPHNSRLSKRSLDKNGFKRMPIWQDALKRYLKEIGE